MKNQRKFLALLTGVFLLSPTLAFANDYYVSKANGSESATGSISSPFKDISQCARIMVPGDTCWVGDGVYDNSPPSLEAQSAYEPVNSGTREKPIAFRAQPGASPLLRGVIGTNPDVDGHRDYIIWSGFTFEGTFFLVGRGGHNKPRVKGWVIENNEITKGAFDGDGNWSGIYVVDGQDIVIRDNYIHNIRSFNQYDDGAAIRYFRCNGCIAEHNLIANNQHDGAFDKEGGVNNVWRKNIFMNNKRANLRLNNQPSRFYGSNPDDESSWIWNERTQVSENLFICDEAGEIHIRLLVRVTNARIFNNTFVGCDAIISHQDDNTGWESYNNIFYATRSFFAYRIHVWNRNEPRYSNHNLFFNAKFRENQYSNPAQGEGEETTRDHNSLGAWKSRFPQYDQNSISGNPGFVDSDPSYRLKPDSAARGKGRNGENLGAYPSDSSSPVGPRTRREQQTTSSQKPLQPETFGVLD